MVVVNVSFPMCTCFLMDGNMASSRNIINMFANSGPNGDPMATEDAGWSSSENLFILINRYKF